MTAAPQVELRPLREEDRDRLLAWRNSPEVAPYMYADHAITPEEHARWFTGIAGDSSWYASCEAPDPDLPPIAACCKAICPCT